MANLEKRDFDAVVVGAGPNGLAAAITLRGAGLSVLLIEGKDRVGGGLRSESFTAPGFIHDVCSAIHPLAVASPFFSKLPLVEHGLEFVYPTFAAAHPFDDEHAAVVDASVYNTARLFGKDEKNYLGLIKPVVKDWRVVAPEILGPLRYPRRPLKLARFGIKALQPATLISNTFETESTKGLWAGMAAHSMLPLNYWGTSAVALVLLACAHNKGWPIAKGGSESIAKALLSYFLSIGGKLQVNTTITALEQLPSSHAVLFDITPKQLLAIAGHKFSSFYKGQLQRYRYGMGVFKIDWALDQSIPFRAAECRMAGTVHLGGSFNEIAISEQMAWKGQHSDKPFVLLAQPTLFDPSRAPDDKHTAWAYCHVPHGSNEDYVDRIERQVERFAPGFRKNIIARHSMTSADMEAYNPNYIGGDINGGAQLLTQLFTRPALRGSPYRTSAKGLYLCSSSTPPGGGVHGMCGYYSARRALKDVFKIDVR